MDVFVFMYICLFFLWAISGDCKKIKNRIIICVTSFLVIWLIQALRDISIGTDLKAYIPFFESGSRRGLTEYSENRMEYGYQLYSNFVAHYVTADSNIFLAITSAVLLMPISYIIGRYSKSPVLSFIIFVSFIVYHFSFSGLRQAVAIGFTFFSYKYIVEKKFVKFLTIIITAFFFHNSAIIFIIAYPLCNWIKLTKTRYLIVGLVSLFGLFLIRSIAAFALELIFSDGRYDNYLQTDYSGAYMLLILIIIFFLFTFMGKDEEIDNYRKLLFCAALFQSLGLISPSATRIGYYFSVFLCMAVPQVTYSLKNAQMKTLYNIGIAFFMVFFFFYTNSDGYLDVMPYRFFWEV